VLQAAPHGHGIKEGVVKRLVLFRPRLCATAIHALLSDPAKTQLSVDIFYESAAAREKRDVMLRHAYPHGASHVFPVGANGDLSIGAGLYASLLSSDSESPAVVEVEGALMHPDFESIDMMGQSVFWAELSFEMSRDTKQSEAIMSDLDAYEISEAARPVEAPQPARPLPTAADAKNGRLDAEQPGNEGAMWVGALVVRGNRCVLARSLASPPAWSGMRLPFVERRAGEAAIDGAMRAASGSAA
jgi:hypothetical protein